VDDYDQGQCGSCWAFSVDDNNDEEYAVDDDDNKECVALDEYGDKEYVTMDVQQLVDYFDTEVEEASVSSDMDIPADVEFQGQV